VTVIDPDAVLDALTGRMTGHQLSERLCAPSRDVVPLLNSLWRDGLVSRTVTDQSVVRFAPLAVAAAASAPGSFSPDPALALAA
jgi:hypothetical protein